MAQKAQVAVVVVAAGRGERAGGGMPKQFRRVGDEIMLRRCLLMLVDAPNVGLVQPVIRPEDRVLFDAAADKIDVLPPAFGGATRQASVRAGLEALAARKPDIVLVHDAARPFATPALVKRAIDAAEKTGAAVPGLPVTDTIKAVDDGGFVAQTLDRARLRAIQTPQGFAFAPLLDAHRRAAAQGRFDFTDDAALAEWAGMKVSVFEGEPGNIKITSADDFARAESAQFAALGDVRIGTGIDVHAFASGDHVMLGGVRIAHGQTLSGHSDADVVLHAATDALLGALADGDIGAHFPPERSAMARRLLRPLSQIRGRARERARRPHRAYRHHGGVRGAQDRPASRRHARQDRRDRRHRARAGGGEGDNERKIGLHRPRRRHRGLCDCHGAAAMERRMRSTL